MYKTLTLVALLFAIPSATMAMLSNAAALQADIQKIKAELANLPIPSENSSPWTMGYRSGFMNDDKKRLTIALHFLEPAEIDLVAILPMIRTPNTAKTVPFGFPKRFTIERIAPDGSNQILVDHSTRDYVVSGIEPQLFNLEKPVIARGIRLTVLQHAENPTWWNAKYITALSEIMVFSDEWNVALGSEIKVSSSKTFGYTLHPDCLVDGFSAFSPVDGQIQSPFEDFYWYKEHLSLSIDLGENRNVDELRIWPVLHTKQHHFPLSSGIDFPIRIRLQKLDHPNALEGADIYLSPENPMRPGSSVLMLRFPKRKGRYFRLTMWEPVVDFRNHEPPRIALSEIELLEQGQQLLRGPLPLIKGQARPQPGRGEILRLTDGRTTEGQILPQRTWITGLNRRAALQRQLEVLENELQFAQRLERERLILSLIAITCSIPILIWLVRMFAEQRWKRIRDQIASDLHDEIGANVSSLGHTIELIKETIDTPSAIQTRMLDEAIHTAHMTSDETQAFIQLLERNQSGFDLAEQIQKVCRQILGDIDYDYRIAANVTLTKLRVSRQWDLLLFVKEALNNIIKHAGATRVEIQISQHAKNIHLQIRDNGIGIPDDQNMPRHLQLRAKRLKGKLKFETAHHAGTQIQLTFQ